MSLKDRFANHSDTPAEQPQAEEQKSVELYDTPGHARNICFVQADGSMTFLNYAYLVSAAFDSEKTMITLLFTTHQIRLTGVNLSNLFKQLFLHKVECVIFEGERYSTKKSDIDIIIQTLRIEKL